MSALTITLNTDNEAFETHAEYEVARILRELADRIESGDIDDDGASIHDVNGNTIGQLTVEEA
jgi:hypothetical protein